MQKNKIAGKHISRSIRLFLNVFRLVRLARTAGIDLAVSNEHSSFVLRSLDRQMELLTLPGQHDGLPFYCKRFLNVCYYTILLFPFNILLYFVLFQSNNIKKPLLPAVSRLF